MASFLVMLPLIVMSPATLSEQELFFFFFFFYTLYTFLRLVGIDGGLLVVDLRLLVAQIFFRYFIVTPLIFHIFPYDECERG